MSLLHIEVHVALGNRQWVNVYAEMRLMREEHA